MSQKQPVYFIPHGGGPWHVMDGNTRFGNWADLRAFLESVQGELPEKPKAILAITAHWDDVGTVTISTAEKPGMYYDYYGFPPHTYEIKYPAPARRTLRNMCARFWPMRAFQQKRIRCAAMTTALSCR